MKLNLDAVEVMQKNKTDGFGSSCLQTLSTPLFLKSNLK